MMRYDTYEYHIAAWFVLSLSTRTGTRTRYRYRYILVATCTVCLQVSMIRCRYPYGIVEVERYVHTGTCTGTEQGLINQN